jgi:hypothetical protein
LLRDLKNDARYNRFNLDEASQKAAEAEDGLNIEGLSSTADGNLLIGFRNPIPDKKALVVPLTNPKKLLEGNDAKLGDPILLDLGGRGVRSLEYWPEQMKYLIIAGPYDDHGDFRLYEWSGNSHDDPKSINIPFGDLHPEALFVRDKAAREIQILSDDGGREIGPGKHCKKLDQDEQFFRSVRLKR